MAEWPCCHDPLRFSAMSLRFVPPEPLQGHDIAEAGTRSDSVPGISGLDSPRIDGEDCWSVHWGGGSHATGGKNRQRRFVQLGVRRGKSATQIVGRTWAGRQTVQARQEKSLRGHADETTLVQARRAVLESEAPTKSAKSAELAAGADYESGRFMVQGLMEKTVGPDKGAVAAMPTGGKSAAQICAAAGSSGRIGSANFSTNMGWTMDCPGHAGKFIEGTR